MNNVELWKSVINTLSIESNAISSLISTVEEEKILETVKLIADCKGKTIVAGCGTSGLAARKIAHSLCCVGQPACYMNPSDAVHGGLGLLQEKDIFILISKGGNTKEILSIIPACKTKLAKLIGVSENPRSILATESNVFLQVKVDMEPCPFNMLATASTLAVIAVFDAICIALMIHTNYTKEQFTVIHPGGAVGDRLLAGEK